MGLLYELLETNLALMAWAISAVNSSHVYTHVGLLFELPVAKLTLELGAFSAMNSRHVSVQAEFLSEFLAANLALVSGVRMLWSRRWRRSGVALSMRLVVVSADRLLVAEHRVTHLDTRRPSHLKQTKPLSVI